MSEGTVFDLEIPDPETDPDKYFGMYAAYVVEMLGLLAASPASRDQWLKGEHEIVLGRYGFGFRRVDGAPDGADWPGQYL